MSGTAMRTPPTYLKTARLEAGYANRDIAAMDVPFSPEQIGRHERGEIPLTPLDVLAYAKHYQRDDIAFRYCANCPVGLVTGRTATDSDLPHATMRLTQRLRRAAKDIADTLEAVADDGIVDETERPVFDTALTSLHELGETITDIFLCAAARGIKREAVPATPGNGSNRK